MDSKIKISAIIKLSIPVILICGLFCVTTGCHSDKSDTPYFPVARGETGMEALATGALVLENGYLRLSPSYSDNSYLVIWPEGYSLYAKGDEIIILDENRRVIAAVGDNISAAGGEMGWLSALWMKGGFLPLGCDGPYWVSSEIKNLNKSSPGIINFIPAKEVNIMEELTPLFWAFLSIAIPGLVIWIVVQYNWVRFLTKYSSESPVEIAVRRYAKGEITKKELDEIKKNIS